MLPLYDRIDKLCKDNGTNITQMCKAAGVQRSALSDYKSGKNKTISFANLQKIADYFTMTVDELVNGPSQSLDSRILEAEKQKASAQLDAEEEELNEYLNALKNNPGMRVLFSKTKNAKKEDIEKVIKMLDIMRGDDNGGYYY